MRAFTGFCAVLIGMTGVGSSALAQTVIDWQVQIGDPAQSDSSWDVAALPGGASLVLSSRESSGSGLRDLVVTRLLADGSTDWETVFDYAGVDGSDEPVSIGVDAAGNIYAAFTSWGLGRSYAVVKLGPTGNVIWSTRHPVDGAPGAAVTDSAGNTYLSGFAFNGGVGDIMTIKVDASGAVAWDRRYNGPANSWDNAFGIDVDPVGNVLVTGFASVVGTSEDDMPILKYSPEGVLLWDRLYDAGASGYDQGFSVATDSTGAAYVVGEARPSGGFDSDIAVVKYDSDGALQWDDFYAGEMGFGGEPAFDRGLYAGVAPNGDLIAVGFSDEAETGTDIIIRRLAPDGTVLWTRSSEQGVPFPLTESPGEFAIDDQGSVYISGVKEILDPDAPPTPGLGGGPPTLERALVAKYSPGGTLLWEALASVPGANAGLFDIDIDPSSGRVIASGTAFFSCPGGPAPGRGQCDADAQVFVVSIDQSCTPDLNADGFLDFSDILLYVRLFADADALVDLAEPSGPPDFSDVIEYLSLFGAGCP